MQVDVEQAAHGCFRIPDASIAFSPFSDVSEAF
jgi:hypothetical protein